MLRSDGSGLSYQGSLTYTCAGGSPASLEGVTFPGGRFVATTDDAGTTTMTPMLYASDHLGSVRSVVNGLTGETVETNDYYPFGGKWNDGSSSDPTNRYRYNGKEEQLLFSTPYSDYGARQYSSASARWLTLDPLANKYYGISPYAFCANNPVNYLDLDGKRWLNTKNQVVYDENGPTDYATNEERELIRTMMRIKTGRQQLKKIVKSPYNIIVQIRDAYNPQGSGSFSFTVSTFDKVSGRYLLKMNECQLTIYKTNAIIKSSKLNLDINEAMASTFGHEIEHATCENIIITVRDKKDPAIEVLPQKIADEMIKEYKIAVPLLNIDKLIDLINPASKVEAIYKRD